MHSPGRRLVFAALITSEHRARALSADGVVRILASGQARVEPARMPKAPVPAAERALRDAGLTWDDVDVVTTHNPFTVNDIYFHRQTGYPLEKMNPYGCSLVWGQPQGPTGLRAIVELIEALGRLRSRRDRVLSAFFRVEVRTTVAHVGRTSLRYSGAGC